MLKLLSEDAVTQYERDGYYFPVPVLSAEEVQTYRQCLETSTVALWAAGSGANPI